MKTKLNIELFKLIREKIATTPEAYDQRVYVRNSNKAPCGTAACIAGWACVLSGEMSPQELRELEEWGDQEKIHDAAQKALGLRGDEADRLFDGEPEDPRENDGWPEPFKGQWTIATSTEHPQIAIAYLDHIIETGKVLE